MFQSSYRTLAENMYTRDTEILRTLRTNKMLQH